MSVISFGPNQQLSQQQRAAHQMSQKVKQAVWDTSHRLAALNNVPGVDDPNNGDNVDISSATPLPPAVEGSKAVFEANSTGLVHRGEDGQIQKAEVSAQLPNGSQWNFSYQHDGDMLAYSAPSPSDKGQLHVLENLSNGTIAMFEAPQFVPDFAAQLQSVASAAPTAPVSAPPSSAAWGAPQQSGPGILEQAGGFFKKFTGGIGEKPQAAEGQPAAAPQKSISEYAQEGKTKAVDAVKSESGRKWGSLLIGNVGMGLLDKALGSDEKTPA